MRFAGWLRWGHIWLWTTIERSALAPFYSQLLAIFTIGPALAGSSRRSAIDFAVIGEPAMRSVYRATLHPTAPRRDTPKAFRSVNLTSKVVTECCLSIKAR
ncbi:hypothetical protein QT981_02845, partial [Microcoleus sp. herbarium13]